MTEEDDAKIKAMCKEGDLKPSEREWLKKLKNRIAKKEQEQPEVDLEKEIKNKRRTMLLDLFGPMNGEQCLAIKKFARHFYELGLNTRKEE